VRAAANDVHRLMSTVQALRSVNPAQGLFSFLRSGPRINADYYF
jgi:hypothetical protein